MNELDQEKTLSFKFTKTEYLNATISDLLKQKVSEQIRDRKLSLEMGMEFFYSLKLKSILKKAKKIYDEYKIVAKEDIQIGDIDFRFTICFFKYHNLTFKQIEKLITEGYKKFREELEFELECSIELFLEKIYSVLNKLTIKKSKRWRLKSFESGLDQLYFKWNFLDGTKVKLTFKIDRLSKLKRGLLEIYKEKKDLEGGE